MSSVRYPNSRLREVENPTTKKGKSPALRLPGFVDTRMAIALDV